MTGVPDADDEVRKHYSERELVGLTLIVAVMNAYNRMAISFRRARDRGRARC